jgi:hypothetical protein
MLAVLAVALGVAGCISHYGYSVSSSTSLRGKAFQIDGHGVGLLMLTAPDLDATDLILTKCPTGRTSNVVTQAAMRNWFGFVQVYEIVIRGICNDDREVAKR